MSDFKIWFDGIELTENLFLTSPPDFGILPSVSNSFSDSVSIDGNKFLGATYSVRHFSFDFLMYGESYLFARDYLAQLLNRGESKLMISEFPNRYWLARIDGETSFIRDINSTKEFHGTLSFVIASNIAYSEFPTTLTPITQNNKRAVFKVMNFGTYQAKPIVRIQHKENSREVKISCNGKSVKCGNSAMTEIGTRPSQILFSDSIDTGALMNWKTGGGNFTESFVTGGSWDKNSYNGKYYLAQKTYPEGSYWRMTSKWRDIPADNYGFNGVQDFTLETRVAFLNGKPEQKGLMECIISDTDNNYRIGFAIDKGYEGNNAKLRLYNGESFAHVDFDTGANTFFNPNYPGAGIIKIEKRGLDVTFSFNGRTIAYHLFSRKDTVFNKISIGSAKNEDTEAVTIMWWNFVKLTKHFRQESFAVDEMFKKGDMTVFDFNKQIVTVNNKQVPDSLDSSWFSLLPGENELVVDYTSVNGVFPYITCEFQEVYL